MHVVRYIRDPVPEDHERDAYDLKRTEHTPEGAVFIRYLNIDFFWRFVNKYDIVSLFLNTTRDIFRWRAYYARSDNPMGITQGQEAQLHQIIFHQPDKSGAEVPLIDSTLLKPISVVHLSAVGQFDMKTLSTNRKLPQEMRSCLKEELEKYFFNSDVDIGSSIPRITLNVHEPRSSANNAQIISGLRDNFHFLASLFYMAKMISDQSEGEKGTLLVNGYRNIFYLQDLNCENSVHCCRWDSYTGRWGYRVHDVRDCTIRWVAGDQLFSRGSE